MTKPYKCRVEYLESSGTQYIDTGINADSNLNIEFKYKLNSTSSVSRFGALNSSGTIRHHIQCNSSANIEYFASVNISTASVKTSTDTNPHTLSIDVLGMTAKYDNTSYTFANTVTPFNCGMNYWLFKRNSDNSTYQTGFNGRIYYTKMWYNGVLVRDFIPVLDNSGVPCLYDNVSGQLFYNQGTGDFSYGREIHYVDYLESTGTQYINTGIKLTNNHSVELDYQLTQATQSRTGLFGNLTSSMNARYGSLLSPTNHYLEYGYGTGNVYWQQGLPDTNRHKIYQKKNEVYFDGTLLYTFNNATFSITDGAPLGNFGYLNYTPAKAKYYSSKWWENDTLVRDFIPAIDENGVGFLFDTVTNTIYDNAGTGAFKFGANVEKNGNKKMLRKKLALMLATLKKKRPFYCEVEYLETTGQQTNLTDTTNASWIDTGITPDDTTQMECRVSFTTLISGTDTEALFGSTGSIGNFRFAFGFASLSPYTNFYIGLGGQNLTTSVTRDTNVHTFKIDAINKTWSIDDTSGSFTSSGSLSGTSSIFLFARHIPYYGDNKANKPANAKIYYCKIWQGGRLVRDMIPVLDWNYTPCMYDKITGQLFYTKGTKQFTYGREIHYVDYLESTGTQWIDLETTINTSTDEVELFYQITGATVYKWIFGEHETNARFGLGSGDGTNLRNVAYYNSTSKVSDSLMYNNQHHFLANTEGVFIDGTKIVNYTPFSSSRYLLLFNLNESPYNFYCSGKVWSYRHKRNGVFIRDYIPAIDENGVGFMFDRVTHTIFDNAGTGAFKYPARETEYIEGTGSQYINTEFKPNQDTKIDLVGKFKTTYPSCLYATRWSQAPTYDTYGAYAENNALYTYYGRYSDGQYVGVPYSEFNYKNSYIRLIQDKNNLNYTNLETNANWTYSFTKLNFQATTNLYLLHFYTGTSFATNGGYLKTCKIWDNGTLVRDFIPVFQDSVAGMYDRVNNVFYRNVGSGTFLTGKIIESEWF